MGFAQEAATFEESIENEVETVEGGDTCPEDECDRELFELNHPRNPQFGSKRHEDAPETEVVCIHHGIVEAR